jgi:4-amino-4-deoxy-L-arabinose transferase-like glycosyltransferase
MRPRGLGPGRGRGRSRGLIIVLALFVLANAAIWVFSDGDSRLADAADGDSWYRPALALMKYGAFVDLKNPALIDTYRPPLYPLFEAAAMAVAGGPSPGAIVVAQIALLLFVGLLFRNLVHDWFPGWENFGMALLIFNPNVLSSAHFVQSEILFLAFVMFTFWAVAKFILFNGSWRFALLTGAGVALACLTRPTAQFLLFVPPILFPLLALFGGRTAKRTAFLQGLGAFVLAIIIVAPWVSLVASQGHGLALSDSAGKYRYVWDQVTMIDAQSRGLSYHEAGARLTKPGGAEYDFIARHGKSWKSLSRPERNNALADEGMAVLVSYPVVDFAKALYRSQAQFFLGGGAGNWHNLFGVGAQSASSAWFANAQDDLWSLLKNLVGGLPPFGLIFSGIAIGFSVAARVLGLMGLPAFFNQERWGLFLIVAGFVAYFALIHVFVGNSRYRVSIEPMLMLLVLAGLDNLGRLFRRA